VFRFQVGSSRWDRLIGVSQRSGTQLSTGFTVEDAGITILQTDLWQTNPDACALQAALP
jgi:hypothetical protein